MLCGAALPNRKDIDEHINWCMGQPRLRDALATETQARKTQLDNCRAIDADCTAFGLELARKFDELKAKQCMEAADLLKPDSPSSGPDALKRLCRAAPVRVDEFRQSAQSKLDACNARIAAGGPAGGPADGGPAGTGDGAGNPGDAGDQAGDGANPEGDAGAGDAADANVEPAPEQCEIVQIEPEVKPDVVDGPNLTITKKADPCVLNAAKARFECNFVVTIANSGNAPFKGPVTIQDTMPLADGLTVGVTTAEPWSCPSVGDAKDGVRACNARDVTLAPQDSITLPLQVTVPSNMTSLCVISNEASIKEPAPGSPLNVKDNDDRVNPTAAVLPNKQCRPVNLSVAKTATPDCVKNAAGNFVCSYKIAIRNTRFCTQ